MMKFKKRLDRLTPKHYVLMGTVAAVSIGCQLFLFNAWTRDTDGKGDE